LLANELRFQNRIKEDLKGIKIYDKWLSRIKGIGPLMAGCIVSEVGREHKEGKGIGAFSTISKLWYYAGIAPRSVYQKEHNFNWFLKMTLLGEQKVIDQFILHKHPFGYGFYISEKEELRRKHPEKIVVEGKTKFNDGHLANMAKKELAAIFMSHLWLKWRTLEGLPLSKPYSEQILQHSHIYSDPDVWVTR
jgi:hypothetical protein